MSSSTETRDPDIERDVSNNDQAHKENSNAEDSIQYEIVSLSQNDTLNPKNLPPLRKWIIVLLVSAGSLCVTSASSMYTTTYEQIEKEFAISQEVAVLGLSLFVVGLGIGPMLTAPLSELNGRRPIYIISFGLFLIWLIPSAVAKSYAPLLVSRFFQGFCGAAMLTVAGGTVGDLFEKEDLFPPMIVFTASPFIGPPLGPLVSGFINQFTNWRWTFYVLLIWAGITWLSLILFVPETFAPVLTRTKAQQLRTSTGNPNLRAPLELSNSSLTTKLLQSCYRPFLLLALEPMCLNLCTFSALLLGILYLFFGAFQLVFEKVYHLGEWQRGMCFGGLLVGEVFAVVSNPIWSWYWKKLRRGAVEKALREGKSGAEDGKIDIEPEWRLPPAILGAPCCSIGLFWFAWSLDRHWICPIIGSAVFSFGMTLVFCGIFTYSVECWSAYAASALAANSFLRSSWAAAFPLFGDQMYEKLGYSWATTLLAFLTVVMLPFPYIFFKYGKRIRKKSRFAGSQ